MTCGRISRSANSRTAWRVTSSASVGRKSMASRLYHAPRGWLLPRHALPPGRLATLRAAPGIGMDRWRDRGESGRSIMKGMGSRGLAGRTLPVALLALLIVAAPGRAFADLTVFAGRATAISRTSGGAALRAVARAVESGIRVRRGARPALRRQTRSADRPVQSDGRHAVPDRPPNRHLRPGRVAECTASVSRSTR